MRKSVITLAIVVISLAATSAVAPRAGALPGTVIDTEYYNYGAYWPSASVWQDCDGTYYSDPIPTPQDGALKNVITFNCSTMQVISSQWYRYSPIDCAGYTPGWYITNDPYYYHTEWPC